MELFYTKYFTGDTLQCIVTANFINQALKCTEVHHKHQPITLSLKNGYINQPNAIARYLATDSQLSGKNNEDNIKISQWFQFFNKQLYPLLQEINTQILGYKQPSENKYNYCLEEIFKILKILDESLKLQTFFVSNNMCIFDVCLCCQLDIIFRLIISSQNRKKFNYLSRWYSYIRQIEPIEKYFGKIVLCGSQTFQIEFHQDFDLNCFKRDFQNSDQQETVIDKLAQQFNHHEWSVWKIHYLKDITEGKVDYLTMNMASGTLQRLDNLRKNGFGVLGVYGQTENYEIRGVFMWQGTEICQEWKEHPSYSYYQFEKLNFLSPQNVQLIKSYWLGSDSAQSLPLYDFKRLI